MRAFFRAALITLAAASVGTPVHAQRWERDRDRDRATAPGWIGISFDPSVDRRGRVTRLVITDVRRGSPADEAGIEEGDHLLRVNDLDRASELLSLSERLRLRVGDRVRVVVERDGRRRDFRLRAAERPRDFVAVELMDRSFEPDSMVESMYRAMDSLKLRLVQDPRNADVRVRSRTRADGANDWSGGGTRVGGSSTTITVVTQGGRTTVQAPFEFFVFRGEEHDSLRRAMDELNRDAEVLQQRIVSRSRELQRVVGSGSGVRFAQDAELSRLEREREALARESETLRSAMVDAARQTAGFEYSRVVPRAAEPTSRLDEPHEEFRPLTPYLLGRNRVAGAEVIDMPPELAAYFRGVEDGVLVVDVAPRTPAAISGILPGDVITHIDRVTVGTVEDLRFGISQAGDTLPITLIRRGSSVQVLLRR